VQCSLHLKYILNILKKYEKIQNKMLRVHLNITRVYELVSRKQMNCYVACAKKIKYDAKIRLFTRRLFVFFAQATKVILVI
jgi:hypothetical protein